MRALAITAAAVIAAVVPAAATAAKPAHVNFHDAFTDTVCGIPVDGVADGVDNFTDLGDGTFRDTYSFKLTFTAAGGRSVMVASAGQVTGTAVAGQDGSTTYTTSFIGLPEKIMTPNGPVLTRDAGVITFVDVVAEDGTLLSSTFFAHGPHPENDSDFALFCGVITQALT